MLVAKPTLKSASILKLSRHFCVAALVCISFFAEGQQCNLKITGKIIDASTGSGLSNANIEVKSKQLIVASDNFGNFSLENMCPGDYHLSFSHLGCATETLFLRLKKDTVVSIFLNHHSELIDEVAVHGNKIESTSQTNNTISVAEIISNANKSIAQQIEGIAGVSSLNTGAGISKPIIHGLYGNRVSIMNNGIAQSGQQWGNDHAPEIDPFVANHISVVKGASALAYGGVNLGGVVLVEPAELGTEPHLHGKANYVFQTNGLGNTVNLQLEKSSTWGSWRVLGTAKLIGDRKSPSYYLTNTGNRELDFAGQYQKTIGRRWKANAYYSLFQTELGILRGSHISNSSDLESAIGQDEPFFTSPNFSYAIEAPGQKVTHHFFKYEIKYLIDDHQVLDFRNGLQRNIRKEFDVRRGAYNDAPSLSLQQFTNFAEGVYTNQLMANLLLKSGLQFNYVKNTNDNSSTDRLPLIPDYQSNQATGFMILQKELSKFFFEVGGRYDYRYLQVVAISTTLPHDIIRDNRNFGNYSISAGAKYAFLQNLEAKIDLGFVQRAPEVNELYSAGLHQGLASIEYGNPNLVFENSAKALLTVDYNVREKLFVQATGYYQKIKNYIYLQPTGEYELTISGSFPIFEYTQTDAQIYGIDFLTSYQASDKLKFVAKYAYLKGDDLRFGIPLIYMPPNNLFLSANYSVKNMGKWSNNSVGVSGKYVAEQKGLLPKQDLLAPPKAYFLLGAEANTTLNLAHTSLDFGLRVENMLNTVYRDYLNRQRYFADDLGINVSFRMTLNF